MSGFDPRHNPRSGHRPHVLLDEPYGRANLGDNAIAYCMSRFLQGHGVEITNSCIDPEYIGRRFRLKAVPMLDFRRYEMGPLKRLGDFDAVIEGRPTADGISDP